MNKNFEKKSFSDGDTSSFLTDQFEVGDHFMGLMGDPSQSDLLWEEYLLESDFILSSEDHGTIRIKNEAGRYRVSMVMKTLISKYFSDGKGLSFKEYWILLELLNSIRGTKHIFEIKDEYERHLSYIATLILKYGKIRGFRLEEQVDLVRLIELNPDLKVKVTNPRIYHSLKEHWHWSRIIIVSIVPVDSRFLERMDHSKKYDSYTKGYGEGSHRAHESKTPFSAELDGEDTDLIVSPSDDPILFRIFNILVHWIYRKDPSSARTLE